MCPPGRARVKLPSDLVVGDSRAGVSRADLPKFNLIQKSARFQETILKLLSTCEASDPPASDITTVALAHLRYLQEEYTNLLVSSQFDEGTSKQFATLQQNPAAFPPNALENLHRAVSIAGACPPRQVSLPLFRKAFKRFAQDAAAGEPVTDLTKKMTPASNETKCSNSLSNNLCVLSIK